MSVQYNIPGKTFLLGEYSVLHTGKALIACTKPYFSLEAKLCEKNQQGVNPFHPKSPAGKFIHAYPEVFENLNLYWTSPYPQGGFGGSTAEFLGCYKIYCSRADIQENLTDLYNQYLHYANNLGVQPSGADLMAQTKSKIVYVQRTEMNAFAIESLKWPFEATSLLFFKTPYKLATHEHLKTLSNQSLNSDDLTDLTLKGYDALKNKNKKMFVDAINDYALCLEKRELTAESTQKILQQLRPYCLAVKGCGALGSDVIVAVISESQQEKFIKHCQTNQLKCVASHRDF